MVNEMRDIVAGYQKRLTQALALSAKRGGSPSDLSRTVAKLTTWLRSESDDFNAWAELVNEAGYAWEQWYDWYTRVYDKPHDDLGGLTVEQWQERRAS